MNKTEAIRRFSGAAFALSSLDKTWQEDMDVVLCAVRTNGLALSKLSQSMKSNREIVLAAVKQNDSALEYAAEIFRDDLEIVMVAVSTAKRAYLFVGPALLNNKEVLRTALQTDQGHITVSDSVLLTQAGHQLRKALETQLNMEFLTSASQEQVIHALNGMITLETHQTLRAQAVNRNNSTRLTGHKIARI